MFQPGQKVEHILSKDWLLVLFYDNETDRYICRTKDLKEVAFYKFELKETH
jgi:hypothetical protein